MNASVATIDFESRSSCDIKKSGSWKYSLDSSTQVLCMAFRLPIWDEGDVCLWHPAFPSFGVEEYCDDWNQLYELLCWIDDSGLVEAHNAWFERGVWTNIMVPTYGWPRCNPRVWRCSAAKAAALALPRALDDAIGALHLPIEKDATGHKLMLKMSRPRKPRQAEQEVWAREHCDDPMPTLWHESPAMLQRLGDYCRMDVLAEHCLSSAIPDLSDDEVEIYLLDQEMNERGFRVDSEAITAALALVKTETVVLNRELVALTNGQVLKATNKAKMKVWLEEHGCRLENMQAATLVEALKDTTLPADAYRGLQIVKALAKSSTAKYIAMQQWACEDSRIRGGLLYHGASTGRWTGSGPQPHNLPKGDIDDFDMDEAWELIKQGNPDALRQKYNADILRILAQAIRGAIVPSEGHNFYVADYAGIEARISFWIADDQDALNMFHNGIDIYCDMATDIYNRPITKADKTERQLGKAATLGCGFGMGFAKFVGSAAGYGVTIDEEFSATVVKAFRRKFYRVVDGWSEQQDAAIRATRAPGRPIASGRVEWLREGKFLFCTLPSGRRLAYAYPQVKAGLTPWGAKTDQLSFMGVDPKTKQWVRQRTWGGTLWENIVQAIARDLMANGMLNLKKFGLYVPILSVHDEGISEVPDGMGNASQYEKLLSTLPDWAYGCPITAESWVGKRYKK